MMKTLLAGFALSALLAVGTGTSFAAESASMKACAAQWDAMKKANTVPAGTTWKDFEKTCAAQQSAVPAAPAAPAAAATKMAAPVVPAATKVVAPAVPAAPAVAATKMAAPVVPAAPAAPAVAATAGATAEHSREANCSAQWKDMKVKNTRPVGMKWPQFWHDCDTKLKAAGL